MLLHYSVVVHVRLEEEESGDVMGPYHTTPGPTVSEVNVLIKSTTSLLIRLEQPRNPVTDRLPDTRMAKEI